MKITRKHLINIIDNALKESMTYSQILARGKEQEKVFADWMKSIYPEAIHNGEKGQPDVTIGNVTIEFGMPQKRLWLGNLKVAKSGSSQKYPHLDARWNIFSQIPKVKKAHFENKDVRSIDPDDAMKIWANCGYDVAAKFHDSGYSYRFMALTEKGYKFLKRLYSNPNIDVPRVHGTLASPSRLEVSNHAQIVNNNDRWSALLYSSLFWGGVAAISKKSST